LTVGNSGVKSAFLDQCKVAEPLIEEPIGPDMSAYGVFFASWIWFRAEDLGHPFLRVGIERWVARLFQLPSTHGMQLKWKWKLPALVRVGNDTTAEL
jgi:hypothetical protein